MNRCYTGVGSRRTPDDVILLMEGIGEVLATRGWTLRSGAADGADTAFEAGALRGASESTAGLRRPFPEICEIYLPWPGFNGHNSSLNRPSLLAMQIARAHHPNWDAVNSAARRLHARNVHQVLGQDVDNPSPSRFLLCWTYAGRGGGGTGTAIRVAKSYRVPVWDLGDHLTLHAFKLWVGEQLGVGYL